MSMGKRSLSQFAVIGMGKFGQAIARELYNQGKEVLAIDINEDKINLVSEFTTHAVTADASDEQAIAAIGIANFDAVIVCMGSNMQASILTTLICKEQGAPYIVAKANSRKHKAVLTKIGADLVVEPEEEIARKMAIQFAFPRLNDMMELSANFTIAETEVPERWYNRNLIDIDMRRRYGITLLIVKRNNNTVIASPAGDTVLMEGDSILFGGSNDDIDKFLEKLKKI